jgi:hypothetical protein
MKGLCLSLLAAACVQAQIVEGTALNATAGIPLAGVKTKLLQGEMTVYETESDPQGAFRIEGVKDGDYSAAFSKKGFRQPDRNAAARRPFHVTAGANPIRLDVRMQALAKVSGRVIGGGQPIRGAEVQLLIAGDLVGQTAKSDANGEFQFEDMDTGTYLLRARAPNGADLPAEQDGRKLAWVRTWYPSETSPGGSARIVLKAGADVIGQDVRLRTAPVYRVRGSVLSERGLPMAGVVVKAQPPDELFIGEFQFVTLTKADGSFELPTLTDGDWRLTAEEGALRIQMAQQIAGREVDRVEIRMRAPFPVVGEVVRIGAVGEQKPTGVMLAPREGGDHLSYAMTDVAGRFRIENVPPGTYRFMPISPGPTYYLASVQLGARDVLGQYVELAPGLPVTITYRSDGGTVRGTVEDCGTATVVLAPQDPSLQYPEFIRRTKCQQNGRYEVTSVRPGEYYAFAFDTPPGVLESSSFTGQWMNQAVRITVRSGEATDASLKVTQRGPF